MTLNNITVKNSNIGVLNTGRIGDIDSAVGVMVTGGDDSGAEAFRKLTEGVIELGIDPNTKNKVLEILSVLASEATVPPSDRRKSAMRPLLVDLASICGGIAGLADLYGQYAPAIEGLFK